MTPLWKVVGVALAISLLAAFFVWVLVEMAWASNAYFRLDKLAIGFGIATVGVGAIYALTAPLGRRCGKDEGAAGTTATTATTSPIRARRRPRQDSNLGPAD